MEEALILIVDDQPDNSDTIIEYLEESEESYKFLQALNGKVACKVAGKRNPDLIIMDWEMPEMNGYEALLWLKNNSETSDIPVVMATGRSSGADLSEALKAGAADYIRKPIERQELLARVNSCLRISRYLKEIRLKNRELKSLNDEKSSLIGIVAHDLKNPLSNIIGSVDIVSESDDEKVRAQFLDIMKQSGTRMINMITEILNVEAIEQRLDNLELSNIDITKMLDTIVDQFKKQAANKKIRLVREIQGDINVLANTTYLPQVVENLLSNAIKFSPEDRNIYIKLTVADSLATIEVKDEGPGLTKKDKSMLFQKYQKLSAKPTGGENSTGLGLSIVKKFVDAMKGKIWCESEEGKGASFLVSLSLSNKKA